MSRLPFFKRPDACSLEDAVVAFSRERKVNDLVSEWRRRAMAKYMRTRLAIGMDLGDILIEGTEWRYEDHESGCILSGVCELRETPDSL